MSPSRIPSSSALPLVRLCAASWAMPHTRSIGDRSRMGDAIHDHLQDRAELGVGEAMRHLEKLARRHELSEREEGIFVARCRGFEWSPPAHAFGEVGLALLEDGTVVRVPGRKGEYSTPAGALTAGTLDVMWSEPEPLDITDPDRPRCPAGSILWVVDYKTGDEAFVEPIEHNAQARTNALLAAKWTGAVWVLPAILFIRKGLGEWDAPAEPWGPVEAARHEVMLRVWLQKVRTEQDLAARGQPLTMVEGKHCEFCPARAHCSAHTALIRSVVTGAIVPQGHAPITPAERVWLAEHLRMIEGFARQARQVLAADVDANGPIELSDGNLWGRYEAPTTSIVVDEALVVLADELGPARASSAVLRSMSRDSIEEQVRDLHREKGIKRQLAPTLRRIFAKLGEAGALLSEKKSRYGAHKPKMPEPTLEDLLEDLLEASLEDART